MPRGPSEGQGGGGHCLMHPSVGGRDALEGKGPQRRPQRRLYTRLEAVAKPLGGGYRRLQMPSRLALGVRGTVAGRRLSALEGGGGTPPSPFQCIPRLGGTHPWAQGTTAPTVLQKVSASAQMPSLSSPTAALPRPQSAQAAPPSCCPGTGGIGDRGEGAQDIKGHCFRGEHEPSGTRESQRLRQPRAGWPLAPAKSGGIGRSWVLLSRTWDAAGTYRVAGATAGVGTGGGRGGGLTHSPLASPPPPPPPTKKKAQLTRPQNPTEIDPPATEVTRTQNSAKKKK